MKNKIQIAHIDSENDLNELVKELLPMVKRVCEYGRDSFDLYSNTGGTMNPLYLDCIRSLPKIDKIQSLLK